MLMVMSYPTSSNCVPAAGGTAKSSPPGPGHGQGRVRCKWRNQSVVKKCEKLEIHEQKHL